MNIAVAIRLMPKLGDELEVDESGTDIDRELVEMVINEFDEQALEEAVLIKEATGATVIAVGLRTDGIDEALHVAYARGADRLVVVEAGEIDVYDSRTAALAFAEAFRQLAPDLVLTGVQTPSDVFGQAGALPRHGAGLASGERRRRRHAGRWNRARRAGVRRWAARRAGPPAAGGRRRAVRELAAPVRRDGPAAPGDDRGQHRDARCQRRGARSRRRSSSSLARPAPQTHATMLEGDAEEAAAKIVEVLRERGVLAG